MELVLYVLVSVVQVFHFKRYTNNNVSFVEIRLWLTALYLKINIPTLIILAFQEVDFFENQTLSPHTHNLHAVYTGYGLTIIKDTLLT
jgi:hypothetical protein